MQIPNNSFDEKRFIQIAPIQSKKGKNKDTVSKGVGGGRNSGLAQQLETSGADLNQGTTAPETRMNESSVNQSPTSSGFGKTFLHEPQRKYMRRKSSKHDSFDDQKENGNKSISLILPGANSNNNSRNIIMMNQK